MQPWHLILLVLLVVVVVVIAWIVPAPRQCP
jgi:hypothetical protein